MDYTANSSEKVNQNTRNRKWSKCRVLIHLQGSYLDVHTLKDTLSAITVVAGLGEMNCGIPRCPKSTQVPPDKMGRASTLQVTWMQLMTFENKKERSTKYVKQRQDVIQYDCMEEVLTLVDIWWEDQCLRCKLHPELLNHVISPLQTKPTRGLSPGLLCGCLHSVRLHQPGVAQRADRPWWCSSVVRAESTSSRS